MRNGKGDEPQSPWRIRIFPFPVSHFSNSLVGAGHELKEYYNNRRQSRPPFRKALFSKINRISRLFL